MRPWSVPVAPDTRSSVSGCPAGTVPDTITHASPAHVWSEIGPTGATSVATPVESVRASSTTGAPGADRPTHAYGTGRPSEPTTRALTVPLAGRTTSTSTGTVMSAIVASVNPVKYGDQ
jgi:hypothetical protein